MKLLILTLLIPLFAQSQTPTIDSLAKQRIFYRTGKLTAAQSDMPEPDRTILYQYYDSCYRATGKVWADSLKEWMDRRKQYLIDSLKRKK